MHLIDTDESQIIHLFEIVCVVLIIIKKRIIIYLKKVFHQDFFDQLFDNSGGHI